MGCREQNRGEEGGCVTQKMVGVCRTGIQGLYSDSLGPPRTWSGDSSLLTSTAIGRVLGMRSVEEGCQGVGEDSRLP